MQGLPWVKLYISGKEVFLLENNCFGRMEIL